MLFVLLWCSGLLHHWKNTWSRQPLASARRCRSSLPASRLGARFGDEVGNKNCRISAAATTCCRRSVEVYSKNQEARIGRTIHRAFTAACNTHTHTHIKPAKAKSSASNEQTKKRPAAECLRNQDSGRTPAQLCLSLR